MELLSSDVAQFLERFLRCYDGVIYSIEVDFFGRDRNNEIKGTVPRTVKVVLNVRDNPAEVEDDWISLILEIENVTKIRLLEGDRTSVVLSSGISIKFYNERVYIAFDAEIEDIEEFEQAVFLVVGSKLHWSVSDYTVASYEEKT